MNGSHCWPTGPLFNQDRLGLIRILTFSLSGFKTQVVRFCAHCSQSTMFYLLWHTCGTLNHLTWWCRRMFSCFQFVVGSVSHFSCIWLAHIAGPPVSCSIRIGRVWLNIGIQLDKFYITCLIFWRRSQSTTCSTLFNFHVVILWTIYIQLVNVALMLWRADGVWSWAALCWETHGRLVSLLLYSILNMAIMLWRADGVWSWSTLC